jgi:hypothetical protein
MKLHIPVHIAMLLHIGMVMYFVCLAVQCSNFRIDADTVLLEMSLRVAEG